MKNIIGIILLFTLILQSCNEPPFPTLKQCKWYTDGTITFGYPLELRAPTSLAKDGNFLVLYNNPVRGLNEIFFKANKTHVPKIDISTTQNGCDLDQTKTTSITAVYNYTTPSNVSTSQIKQIDKPGGGYLPTTTIEISSGNFQTFTGEVGHVIWSKTLASDPFSTPQNGVFEGKFVITSSTKSIIQPVYVGSKYQLMEI